MKNVRGESTMKTYMHFVTDVLLFHFQINLIKSIASSVFRHNCDIPRELFSPRNNHNVRSTWPCR